MKYIRTKDGIWKVLSEDKISYICEDAKTPPPFDIFTVLKTEVIKEADAIDELCDAFVMFCPNAVCRKIRVYETMHSISLYSKRDKRWNGNMVDKVYGAIWTDKGLIYVAKMNEKGELELL